MRVLLATNKLRKMRARPVPGWLSSRCPPTARLRVVTAVSIPPSALDLPTVRDFLFGSLREEARGMAESAQHRSPLAQIRGAGARRRRAGRDSAGRRGVAGRSHRARCPRARRRRRFLSWAASRSLSRVTLAATCWWSNPAPASSAASSSASTAPNMPIAAAQFVAGLPLDPMVVVQLTGVVQSPPMPATTPAFAKTLVREAARSDREGAYSRARARHRQGGRALRGGRQDRKAPGARRLADRRPARCRGQIGARPGRGRRSRPGDAAAAATSAVSPRTCCAMPIAPCSS